jgi:glycosyltransferase involved in cell wall biosynthesis
MDAAPLLSVVMPVHNGMPYLPEAVASILGQTLRAFEFVIIDDGSTDDTPAYLRSLDDPRVRVHRVEKTGIVQALNHGLRLSRAPLIARMDADDASHPTRFEKQYAYFRDHPDCVLLSCHFEYMDLDGAFVREHRNLLTDEAIRWQMFFTTPFVHPGAVFVRAAAAAVGDYSPEYPTAQDYDLWSRLAARGRMANYPETLLRYRYNPNSNSGRNSTAQRDAASRIAGAYAESVDPALKAATVRELYMFLAAGHQPQGCTPEELARTFRAMKSRFLDGRTAGEELVRQVRDTQKRLRWRCLEECRRNALRPVAGLRWLRLARAFDPDGASLAGLIGRRVRRAVGRSGPIA